MYFHRELLEALDSDPRRNEIDADLIKLRFGSGYEKYSRYALIVSGRMGKAEASPLKGYFENVNLSVSGAISSVLDERPIAVRDNVIINALISQSSDIETVDKNAETVKVKVTSLDDIVLVQKVRDTFGFSTKIRIDCNGSFDVEGAEKLVDALSVINLEFIEQPCKTNAENAHLRKKIDIPLAIDETACSKKDIDEIKALDAADIIVVKAQTSGGIKSASELIQYWGKDVVISSMMESDVGINLGMVLAKSIENLNYACGLSNSPIDDIISEPFDK